MIGRIIRTCNLEELLTVRCCLKRRQSRILSPVKFLAKLVNGLKFILTFL